MKLKTRILADEWFELKAEQADLKQREKLLREKILRSGETAIEGYDARLTVSHTDAYVTFDAVSAKEYFEDHDLPVPTRIVNGSVRIVAKQRQGVDA